MAAGGDSHHNLDCDLFCTVIDNFGDAGVCWRLAQQLAAEHRWIMRLWIDDIAPLALLRPGIDPGLESQRVDGVTIRRWRADFPVVVPAQVVIEAFACELPHDYMLAMARHPRPPVWINLEYLSAESWIEGCHGLASPHPRLPLTRYFFFPGFTAASGGLMRERRLVAPSPVHAFLPLRLSLFCYDNPALPRLLDVLTASDEPVECLVAAGLPQRQVQRWLGHPFDHDMDENRVAIRGHLALIALPFVPQVDYDALLADCVLNFVRGEDSFVRAQWAERPFVWQPYPQDDEAHLTKLDAFLGRYVIGLDAAAAQAVTCFSLAWNGRGDLAAAWPVFRLSLPILTKHASAWSLQLQNMGNLTENLARFCEEKL